MDDLGYGLAALGEGLGTFFANRRRKNEIADFIGGINVSNLISTEGIDSPTVQAYAQSEGIDLSGMSPLDAVRTVKTHIIQESPELSAQNYEVLSATETALSEQLKYMGAYKKVVENPDFLRMVDPDVISIGNSLAESGDWKGALDVYVDGFKSKTTSELGAEGTAEGKGDYYMSPEGQVVQEEYSKRKAIDVDVAEQIRMKYWEKKNSIVQAQEAAKGSGKDKDPSFTASQVSAIGSVGAAAANLVKNTSLDIDKIQASKDKLETKLLENTDLSRWMQSIAVENERGGVRFDNEQMYGLYSDIVEKSVQSGDTKGDVTSAMIDSLVKEGLDLTPETRKRVQEFVNSVSPQEPGTTALLPPVNKELLDQKITLDRSQQKLQERLVQDRSEAVDRLSSLEALKDRLPEDDPNFTILDQNIKLLKRVVESTQDLSPAQGAAGFKAMPEGAEDPLAPAIEDLKKGTPPPLPKELRGVKEQSSLIPLSKEGENITAIPHRKAQYTDAVATGVVKKSMESGKPLSPSKVLRDIKAEIVAARKKGALVDDLDEDNEKQIGDAIRAYNKKLELGGNR